jgi:predicted enzyme related to lactoylglutathione lyase
MSGRIVHFEIPFDDQERASAFYEKAFDWQLASMPGMGYTLVTTGPSGDTGPTEPGYINGGMLQRQNPITSPVLTIDVDDIDAALTTIGELGGSTIRGKEPVGDMGFAAYITDSEGNLVGLWENAPG